MEKNNKSLALSHISVILFMAILAAMDFGGYWLVSWFLSITRYQFFAGLPVVGLFLTSLYLCSFPAWIVLLQLNGLLGNIQAGRVFVTPNVKALRIISWCCFAAAVICLVSGMYYLPFLLLAAAAAFIGLIVRVVKNCFEQAVAMRDELDYTV